MPTEITVLIPTVLIVLNEALKRMLNMPSKFSTLINLVGGIALYDLLLVPAPTDPRGWVLASITGFLLGASAGGLYDVTKTAIQTKFFQE